MPYNSASFTDATVTTSEETISLPSRTAAILVSCPTTNTDGVNVRFGGGSPILVNAGKDISLDIENVCLSYAIQNLEPPPQIFISSISYSAVSGTQTIIITPQEWRVK